jgi:hypothetical protein
MKKNVRYLMMVIIISLMLFHFSFAKDYDIRSAKSEPMLKYNIPDGFYSLDFKDEIEDWGDPSLNHQTFKMWGIDVEEQLKHKTRFMKESWTTMSPEERKKEKKKYGEGYFIESPKCYERNGINIAREYFVSQYLAENMTKSYLVYGHLKSGSFSGKNLGDMCWRYVKVYQDKTKNAQIMFVKNNVLIRIDITQRSGDFSITDFAEKIARIVESKL